MKVTIKTDDKQKVISMADRFGSIDFNKDENDNFIIYEIHEEIKRQFYDGKVNLYLKEDNTFDVEVKGLPSDIQEEVTEEEQDINI